VQQLAGTLPLDKLNSTVDELYDAFRGTGPDLAGFLRSAAQLQDLATANLDPTVKLVRDLVPVLATQQRLAPRIRSAAGDLAAVTGTLRDVDPALRGVIDQTGPMAAEFDALLTKVRPTLPQLLTDLSSTGQVLRVYLPNIQHTLVVFPAAVAQLTSTSAKGGLETGGQFPPEMSALGFKLTFNQPPPCTTGFDPDRIAPSDLSNSRPPPTDAYCKEPKNSPVAVRGFRNAPCPPGSPTGAGSTGATAAACGWHFQPADEAKAAADAAIKHMLEVAARNPKTRAENEAFIGKADFPRAQASPAPPAINGAGNTSHQGPNGLFYADGKPFLAGGLPLPQVSTAGGPVSGLEQFLLAPLLTKTGS
jgi:phospholipid/cholesterol/gamma-HCH transport system substrate-binding protein